jgi:hypothetical protein
MTTGNEYETQPIQPASEFSESNDGALDHVERAGQTIRGRAEYYANLSAAQMQTGHEFAARDVRARTLNRIAGLLSTVEEKNAFSTYDSTMIDELIMQLSNEQNELDAMKPALRASDLDVITEDQESAFAPLKERLITLADEDYHTDQISLQDVYIALQKAEAIVGILDTNTFKNDIDTVHRKEDDVSEICVILLERIEELKKDEYDETLIIKLQAIIQELQEAVKKSDTARRAISRDAHTIHDLSTEIIELVTPLSEKEAKKQQAVKIMSRMSLNEASKNYTDS